MQADDKIRFFLGANSPVGFYSLYDHLIDPAQANAIYILKGGPGCGKSTLMRRIGARAEEMGEQVEYIHCSGDPDSLDGILLHGSKTAVVDGTAPHVVEPRCPGAVEHYVNLGACYNASALAPLRQDILNLMSMHKDCYRRAYRCLEAAAGIMEDVHTILNTQELKEKAAKRAHGILSRELHGSASGTGQVTQRFLGAITHRGPLVYCTTAEVLCKRAYLLEDSNGLSHVMLSHLLTGFTHAGYDVIACPSPMAPDRPEHLLIPALSLSFLSIAPGIVYPKRPYRRLHIDSMIDPELIRRNRQRIRFSRKVSSALLDEAVESLSQAKALHDEMEQLYNPHVDFQRVNQIADELSKAILIH